MRYRVGIIPPGQLPCAPLHLLAGDTVHVTVDYRGLVWESTWHATENTILEFAHWEVMTNDVDLPDGEAGPA